MQAQAGIFALGTTDHCYLEFDLRADASAGELVRTLAAHVTESTTDSGVNLVVAFRPELWANVAAGAAPTGVRPFEPVVAGDYRMPATQHDAWVWIAGGSRDAVFDATSAVIDAVRSLADVATEVEGWTYRHNRDLTGFIDGTENPTAAEAPAAAVVADGPAAGSSVVLFQQWRHRPSFAALDVHDQELVIGRTKDASVEFAEDVMPVTAHVARTVVEADGVELAIFRRNTAYGTPSEHGTLFVAFCAEQRTFAVMLDRMAGVPDGIRDALTWHADALSGGYYVAPAVTAMARFV